MIKKAFLMLLILLLIVSCAKLDGGTVLSKGYVPGHSYTYTTVVMIGNIPITQWHTGWKEAYYYVDIQGVIDKDTVTEKHKVSIDTYEKVPVGGYVLIEK